MNKQQLNPIFPPDEYVPDGEPHVFEDRVYLFGSHDKEGGNKFCMLDYVAYSAPIDDLKNWRYEGVIYRRMQDPQIKASKRPRYMYAPDVVKGNDGKYYIFYGLDGFKSPLKVAVCDSPAGEYEYLGYVRNEDGTPFLCKIPFDPGVINDNGTIRLYYGWSLQMTNNPLLTVSTMVTKLILFGKLKDKGSKENIMGAYTVVLDNDMLTVKSKPAQIAPGRCDARNTPYFTHAFHEASSIRKFNDKYYFIYSSHVNHELCYAVSDYPDRGFKYGGVIISNGDIGFNGRKSKNRLCMTGNNHGSVEIINGKPYIFYHRHTHNRAYSRQACAEEIAFNSDGSINQVEMTNCGLNGGNLEDKGAYCAAICCNLTDGNMPHLMNSVSNRIKPFVTDDAKVRYVTNIYDGVKVGFKYFDFSGEKRLYIIARGSAEGVFTISKNAEKIGEFKILPNKEWTKYEIKINTSGSGALYFDFSGKGRMDFLEFGFIRSE